MSSDREIGLQIQVCCGCVSLLMTNKQSSVMNLFKLILCKLQTHDKLSFVECAVWWGKRPCPESAVQASFCKSDRLWQSISDFQKCYTVCFSLGNCLDCIFLHSVCIVFGVHVFIGLSVDLGEFKCIAFKCIVVTLSDASCLLFRDFFNASVFYFAEHLKSSLTHCTLDEKSEPMILTCIWMISSLYYTVGQLFIRNTCAPVHIIKWPLTVIFKYSRYYTCKIIYVTLYCLGGDRVTRTKGSKRHTWGKCK